MTYQCGYCQDPVVADLDVNACKFGDYSKCPCVKLECLAQADVHCAVRVVNPNGLVKSSACHDSDDPSSDSNNEDDSDNFDQFVEHIATQMALESVQRSQCGQPDDC